MRLFIGVEPPAAVKDAIAALSGALERTMPGRYVRKDMYHITLAFPGEIDEARLNAVIAAVKCAADGLSPFDVALSAPGFFGKIENAILYCGTLPNRSLDGAAAAVRAVLRARDIPFDPKPFCSHITLARHCRIDPAALKCAAQSPKFTANRLTLFHSHRVNGILTYSPIFRAGMAHK